MSHTTVRTTESMTGELWKAIIQERSGAERKQSTKRSHVRHFVHGHCTIRYKVRGESRAMPVNLLNVSEFGLMVRSFEHIAIDTPIEVQLPVEDRRFQLAGNVAHCTQTVGGFKIGIQLAFPNANSTHA